MLYGTFDSLVVTSTFQRDVPDHEFWRHLIKFCSVIIDGVHRIPLGKYLSAFVVTGFMSCDLFCHICVICSDLLKNNIIGFMIADFVIDWFGLRCW